MEKKYINRYAETLEQCGLVFNKQHAIHTLENVKDKIAYFVSTIDKNTCFDKIDDLLDEKGCDCVGDLRSGLYQIIEGIETLGIYHCDTYETTIEWRVQLHVNIRIFPEAIRFGVCNFTGKDLVVVTFILPKKVINT